MKARISFCLIGPRSDYCDKRPKHERHQCYFYLLRITVIGIICDALKKVIKVPVLFTGVVEKFRFAGLRVCTNTNATYLFFFSSSSKSKGCSWIIISFLSKNSANLLRRA